MSASSAWTPNGRPMSTIALNFSAALDDLFKLGSVGELQETVEQKNREVESQKSQLEDLDAQLRQADEQLKKLEIKHKRMSRHYSSRPSVQAYFNTQLHSDNDDAEVLSSTSENSESTTP